MWILSQIPHCYAGKLLLHEVSVVLLVVMSGTLHKYVLLLYSFFRACVYNYSGYGNVYWMGKCQKVL